MDGIIGEIRPFAFNYPPEGWLWCNGTQYAIQQYAALYSIIGTHFGGNGSTSFNVPNLSGTVLSGAEAGVQNHTVWASGGTETVTLGQSQLPSHNHAVNTVARTAAAQSLTGTSQPGSTVYLTNAFSVTDKKGIVVYAAAAAVPPVIMNPAAILPVGGGLSHPNMAPFLAMNFCICYDGVYPEHP